MGNTVLLVDYENVQQIESSELPDEVSVRIFIGAKQTKVRRQVLELVSSRPDRIKPVFIDGQASNALDFHIAFYLGEYATTMPGARFLILSKDKDYDPLIRHLKSRDIQCERIADLTGADLRTKADEKLEYSRTVVWLETMNPKARPSSRKALVSHIANFLQRKPDDRAVGIIVDRLVTDGVVIESGKAAQLLFCKGAVSLVIHNAIPRNRVSVAAATCRQASSG